MQGRAASVRRPPRATRRARAVVLAPERSPCLPGRLLRDREQEGAVGWVALGVQNRKLSSKTHV